MKKSQYFCDVCGSQLQVPDEKEQPTNVKLQAEHLADHDFHVCSVCLRDKSAWTIRNELFSHIPQPIGVGTHFHALTVYKNTPCRLPVTPKESKEA